MSIYEILPALDPTQSVHDEIQNVCIERHPEGQILNFQNTLACDEIRMEIQRENFFGSLISMRLVVFVSHHTTK